MSYLTVALHMRIRNSVASYRNPQSTEIQWTGEHSGALLLGARFTAAGSWTVLFCDVVRNLYLLNVMKQCTLAKWMSARKQRKIDRECTGFNKEWEENALSQM